MSYVPGSPIIFQIDRITQDKGLYAPYSIIRAGERIFFYAGQGFHKIEPGGVPEQIGREKVDRTFLGRSRQGQSAALHGRRRSAQHTRLLGLQIRLGRRRQPTTRLLGYDFVLDRFFPVSVTGEYLLGMSQTGLTLENLDSISSSLDALTLSLDAYATAVQPEIAQFSGTHVLGFFRGANLEATMESAEQGTDENRITIRGFRPDHGRRHALWLGVVSRHAVGAGRRGSRSAGQCPDRPLRPQARHALFALQGAHSRGDVVDASAPASFPTFRPVARYDGLCCQALPRPI